MLLLVLWTAGDCEEILPLRIEYISYKYVATLPTILPKWLFVKVNGDHFVAKFSSHFSGRSEVIHLSAAFETVDVLSSWHSFTLSWGCPLVFPLFLPRWLLLSCFPGFSLSFWPLEGSRPQCPGSALHPLCSLPQSSHPAQAPSSTLALTLLHCWREPWISWCVELWRLPGISARVSPGALTSKTLVPSLQAEPHAINLQGNKLTY